MAVAMGSGRRRASTALIVSDAEIAIARRGARELLVNRSLAALREASVLVEADQPARQEERPSSDWQPAAEDREDRRAGDSEDRRIAGPDHRHACIETPGERPGCEHARAGTSTW